MLLIRDLSKFLVGLRFKSRIDLPPSKSSLPETPFSTRSTTACVIIIAHYSQAVLSNYCACSVRIHTLLQSKLY